MNNAVYGKTLENLRKRIISNSHAMTIYIQNMQQDKKISNDHKRAHVKSGKMFNENVFAIHRIKEE